jgi:hypothetical protein
VKIDAEQAIDLAESVARSGLVYACEDGLAQIGEVITRYRMMMIEIINQLKQQGADDDTLRPVIDRYAKFVVQLEKDGVRSAG